MSDESKKPNLFAIAAPRHDWGEGVEAEMKQALDVAIAEADRVIIIHVVKNPDGTAVSRTSAFTRHGSQLTWLEMLSVLQMKITKWYTEI